MAEETKEAVVATAAEAKPDAAVAEAKPQSLTEQRIGAAEAQKQREQARVKNLAEMALKARGAKPVDPPKEEAKPAEEAKPDAQAAEAAAEKKEEAKVEAKPDAAEAKKAEEPQVAKKQSFAKSESQRLLEERKKEEEIRADERKRLKAQPGPKTFTEEQLRELVKTDPAAALNQFGLDSAQAVAAALNRKEKTPAEKEQERLNKEIADLKTQQAQLRADIQAENQKRWLSGYKERIAQAISDRDAFEFVHQNGGIDHVWESISETSREIVAQAKAGKISNVRAKEILKQLEDDPLSAAKKLEAYYEEEYLQKPLKTKKLKALLERERLAAQQKTEKEAVETVITAEESSAGKSTGPARASTVMSRVSDFVERQRAEQEAARKTVQSRFEKSPQAQRAELESAARADAQKRAADLRLSVQQLARSAKKPAALKN